MTAAVERDLLIVACAISAGVHAALVPEHLDESRLLGVGFVAAAVALGVLAVALRSGASLAPAAAALVLAGAIAAHALAISSGLPLLHPEPDPVDLVGVLTKTVEFGGLALALDLARRRAAAGAVIPTPEGDRP
jgi:hypothetical protein